MQDCKIFGTELMGQYFDTNLWAVGRDGEGRELIPSPDCRSVSFSALRQKRRREDSIFYSSRPSFSPTTLGVYM